MATTEEDTDSTKSMIAEEKVDPAKRIIMVPTKQDAALENLVTAASNEHDADFKHPTTAANEHDADFKHPTTLSRERDTNSTVTSTKGDNDSAQSLVSPEQGTEYSERASMPLTEQDAGCTNLITPISQEQDTGCTQLTLQDTNLIKLMADTPLRPRESSRKSAVSSDLRPVQLVTSPTTLQLILSARDAATAVVKKDAAATPATCADEVSVKRPQDAPLRLPHLREPNKEANPNDPDFTVRLGAFMARGCEGNAQRILQKLIGETERPSHTSGLDGSQTSLLAPNNLRSLTRSYPRTLSLNSTQTEQRNNKHLARKRECPKTMPNMTARGQSESIQILASESLAHSIPGSYITESESGYSRFKRIARLVQNVEAACKAFKRFVMRHDSDGWSFVEMYLHVQQNMRQDLAFNPQNFAKTPPLNGGPRLQQLLSVQPRDRTAQQVQMILPILKGHRGFNDFPTHVQIQLCRVMEYEKFEAHRVLLRQGHRPTAFYMLLTGTLMVNIRDVHPRTKMEFIKTVSDLREGDCFGELALMEQSLRTATIICKTDVELVSVQKEDFDRIIREPLLQQREQTITFCQQNVKLFEDFPCDVFYHNPEGFFFQYCPAGLVVVKDAHKCAYIVFVISGKCRVISRYSSNELMQKRLEAASRDMQKAFPLYSAVLKISKPRLRPSTHPERFARSDKAETDLLAEVLNRRSVASMLEAKRDLGIRLQDKPLPPARPPLRKSCTLSSFFDKVERERRQKRMTDGEPGQEPSRAFWDSRLRGPVLQTPVPKVVIPKSARRSGTMPSQNFQRLEFLRQEAEASAQIAELCAGDVFGLETLVRRHSTRVGVVSEGAELIFISKKLFLREANIRVLRIVNDMKIAYPCATDIHDQLKELRDWNRFKHSLIRQVVTRVGRTYTPPFSQASSAL